MEFQSKEKLTDWELIVRDYMYQGKRLKLGGFAYYGEGGVGAGGIWEGYKK